MADSRINGNQYDYLRRLDVEELERLLQLAVNPQSGEEDSDYVDALLEVILEKEEENDTGRLSDVDEMWQEFQRHYNTEEGKNQHMYYTEEETTPNQVQPTTSTVTKFPKKKLKRTLMVAAVIVFLVSVTSIPVMGYKNVIQLFAQWTGQRFSFGSESSVSISQEIETVPAEYQDLQIALGYHGIDELTIPRYIPDGFAVQEQSLYTSPKTGYITFGVMYQKDEDYIVFQLQQSSERTDIVQEKDTTEIEIYSVGDVDHYIISNNGDTTVTWYIDDIEYAIGSSLPASEINQIIDSIYGR